MTRLAQRNTVLDIVLPLIVFPALSAAAFHYIFGHLHASALDKDLAQACLHHAGPYRLSYTGLNAVDRALCPIISFFHAVIPSGGLPTFLTYALGVSAPLVIMPAVESWRHGRSFAVSYPVLLGCIYQVFSVGMIFPLYWLVFTLGRAHRHKASRDHPVHLTQAHAEAIVFGVIVGAVIPSVALSVLKDPYVTFIWQFFPIYVTIAEYAHLSFRPASKHSQSGHNTIRVLYIGAFVISSSVHISMVWPRFTDFAAVKALLLPSLHPLNASATMESKAEHFLKWDVAFGFISAIIATFWFARNARQFIRIAAWYAISIPLVGPGAALSAVALWRESNIA